MGTYLMLLFVLEGKERKVWGISPYLMRRDYVVWFSQEKSE
jgi:hypothetical protein